MVESPIPRLPFRRMWGRLVRGSGNARMRGCGDAGAGPGFPILHLVSRTWCGDAWGGWRGCVDGGHDRTVGWAVPNVGGSAAFRGGGDGHFVFRISYVVRGYVNAGKRECGMRGCVSAGMRGRGAGTWGRAVGATWRLRLAWAVVLRQDRSGRERVRSAQVGSHPYVRPSGCAGRTGTTRCDAIFFAASQERLRGGVEICGRSLTLPTAPATHLRSGETSQWETAVGGDRRLMRIVLCQGVLRS